MIYEKSLTRLIINNSREMEIHLSSLRTKIATTLGCDIITEMNLNENQIIFFVKKDLFLLKPGIVLSLNDKDNIVSVHQQLSYMLSLYKKMKLYDRYKKIKPWLYKEITHITFNEKLFNKSTDATIVGHAIDNLQVRIKKLNGNTRTNKKTR